MVDLPMHVYNARWARNDLCLAFGGRCGLLVKDR